MRGAKPKAIVPGSSPVTVVPPPPTWLSKEARQEWKRVAPIIVDERRTLTEADLPTFAAYCSAVGQMQETSRTLAKEGLTFMSPTGPKKHPAAALRNEAMNQVRQLGNELGLTPVSRSRAAIRESDDDDSLVDL